MTPLSPGWSRNSAAGDAIVSTGLDGTIRSWNPAATAIYGRPAEEAIGQPFSIVVPADRAEQAGDLLRRVAKGERVSMETKHLGRDGEPLSVSLTAAGDSTWKIADMLLLSSLQN